MKIIPALKKLFRFHKDGKPKDRHWSLQTMWTAELAISFIFLAAFLLADFWIYHGVSQKPQLPTDQVGGVERIDENLLKDAAKKLQSNNDFLKNPVSTALIKSPF